MGWFGGAISASADRLFAPGGEDGFVLTVYLDQNKWIDLARAETGQPKGEPFVETLAAFKQAVDEGRVSTTREN